MGDQVIMTNQARKLGGQTSFFLIVDVVDVVAIVVVCHGKVGTCHLEQEQPTVQHKMARHKIKKKKRDDAWMGSITEEKNLCKVALSFRNLPLSLVRLPLHPVSVTKWPKNIHSVLPPHSCPSCSSFSLRLSENQFTLPIILFLLSFLCPCKLAIFRGKPSLRVGRSPLETAIHAGHSGCSRSILPIVQVHEGTTTIHR